MVKNITKPRPGPSPMKSSIMRFAQNVIIATARPYIFHELPGWGKFYSNVVGDYRRDWFWVNGPIKTIRSKLTGYTMRLDLSQWADRSAFFLGRWEDLEMQLFIADLFKRGDTVVDVGANRGMFAMSVARLVGNEGKVICFEPNPNCIQVLSDDIAANRIANIVVHPCGLADKDDELMLSVPAVNSGEGSFRQAAFDDDMGYQVRAAVRRGDDVLGQTAPTLIKIDVEGFEPKVIAGLTETIRRHCPVIITEMVAQHLETCGSSVMHFSQQMGELGYRGFRLGLKKRAGIYAWHLFEFDAKSTSFDAVWFHSKNMERYAAPIGTHIDAR